MDENGSLALTPEQATEMRLKLALLKRYLFLLMIIPRIYIYLLFLRYLVCSVQFIFMYVDVNGAKNFKKTWK